ncbi:MAG: GspL/Epsl periplasmic domain-containing protein [Mariprofundaceae bacterium]|nr:GspL/Epsl periplasmic domain-containing protein [Mariprofundaceae bacterium]
MIANWDEQCLSVCGVQKDAMVARQFEREGEESFCDLSPDHLDAPVDYLLWPLETLLLRQVSFDLPHVKLVDQDVLANEIEESCGEDGSQWWLSGVMAKREDQITGLAFALAMAMKDDLAQHPVWKQCSMVVPDVWVRLAALLPTPLTTRQAVVDEDETGVCLGVFDAQGCCALRRINKTSWRSEAMMVEELRRSLLAMHLMPEDEIVGYGSDFLAEALNDAFSACHMQSGSLSSRKNANIKALRSCVTANIQSWPNLRHGTWAKQKKIHVDWYSWRVAGGLAVLAGVLLLSGQWMQLNQLQQHHDTFTQTLETLREKALPQGTKDYEPLAQLRQASEGLHDVDTWFFMNHLEAISDLLKKEPTLVIEKIQFKKSQMFLSAKVKDFASVTRVQKILSTLLKLKVVVDDTELNAQQQVRFRMRWS